MYELIFDEKVLSFLEDLQKDLRERIFRKLQTTKENPLIYFERLAGRTDYKLRVGDYRVIADIDNNKKIICVNVIGHRKNIYKK